MSEENKTVELTEEDLEKVGGGKSNCGAIGMCSFTYNAGDTRCHGCPLISTRSDDPIR